MTEKTIKKYETIWAKMQEAYKINFDEQDKTIEVINGVGSSSLRFDRIIPFAKWLVSKDIANINHRAFLRDGSENERSAFIEIWDSCIGNTVYGKYEVGRDGLYSVSNVLLEYGIKSSVHISMD